MFEALTKWHAAAEPPPSDADVARLGGHVRFPLMRRESVQQMLAAPPVLLAGPAMQSMAMSLAMAFVGGSMVKHRWSGGKLYAVGGWGGGGYFLGCGGVRPAVCPVGGGAATGYS